MSDESLVLQHSVGEGIRDQSRNCAADTSWPGLAQY